MGDKTKQACIGLTEEARKQILFIKKHIGAQTISAAIRYCIHETYRNIKSSNKEKS